MSEVTQESIDKFYGKHNVPKPEERTKEGHDKLQAEINAARDAAFAKMTPEIRAKYEKIHAAASILNEEKIPFILVASPEFKKAPIQYSEFSYLPRYSEEDMKIAQTNAWNCFITSNMIFSALLPMDVTAKNLHGEPVCSLREGKYIAPIKGAKKE